MSDVSIVVPFRGDLDSRVRTFNWVWLKERWETIWPDAELVVGHDPIREPFSKTTAVNDGVLRSTGDMLIVADADSWVNRPLLERAIEIAHDQGILVMPWHQGHRLRLEDTDWLRNQDVTTDPTDEMLRESVNGPSPNTTAMVYVIRRDMFDRVGGMDPRFRGWGSEDVCFGSACETLLGRRQILLGHAWAMYHETPRLENGWRIWSGDAGKLNMDLWHRYNAARGDPAAMTLICREHTLGAEIGPVPNLPEHTILPQDMAVLVEAFRYADAQPPLALR